MADYTFTLAELATPLQVAEDAERAAFERADKLHERAERGECSADEAIRAHEKALRRSALTAAIRARAGGRHV